MIKTADRLLNFGEYYFSKKLEEIRRMNQEGQQVLNLGIGSPDLPPPKEVIEALKQSADKDSNHNYQPYRSIKPLRDAMSYHYDSHYQVSLDTDREILPLLGSKEGVMYISMAFLNPGDIVLVPNPGYPAYASIAKMIGAKAVYYNLDRNNHWKPDLEGIDRATIEKAKIMWVNYPNMPTGENGSDETFQQLIEFGKSNNILICNDNPYSFILNDHPKSILAFDEDKTHCLELNSLSKTFNMSGWRVGLVAAHEDYINAILTVKSNVDSGMFKPVQEAAIQALQLSHKWMDNINRVYEKRKNMAFELLNSIGCSFDQNQVGLFIWAKIPEGQQSERFIDELLKNTRVFITPGTVFGSNGEGFVRISLCSTEQNFKEAIRRIGTTKGSRMLKSA